MEESMEGADALGLIAEVGIAIAGFAGVIAALRAPDRKIGIVSAFRIGMLLCYSGSVVLLALFPFALHHAGLTSNCVWTASSGTAGVVLLGSMVGIPLVQRRMRIATSTAPPAGVRWVGLFGWTYMGANVVLQLANVASIGEMWPFYVGLLTITAFSLFLFAWTLLAPASAEVSA
jgi:hypothetical protein